MRFTGERMIPEFNKGQAIHIEHMMRYLFASQFVKDKMVLDIACGSGYGSKVLSEAGAKKVIGVDISTETIEFCKKTYPDKCIEFLVGSVARIPLESNSIDVIVSFETIEHVDEHSQTEFFKESKRILRDDGVLIISTPNSRYYPAGNKFHIKEFSEKEFKDVLEVYFSNIKFYHQSDESGHSIYITAVCSDSTNIHLHDPGATYFSNIDISSLVQEYIDAQLLKDREIASLKSQTDSMNIQLDLRSRELLEIYRSRGWKFVLFVRRISDHLFPREGIPRRTLFHYRHLARKALFVFKREGFKSLFKRSVKYIFHDKAIRNRSNKLEKYNVSHIDSFNIDTLKEIKFSEEDEPEISIIIPVFNKWKYTYNCLDSLKKNISNISFEVIVVDDGSNDETKEMIETVKNVVYLRNEKNLGFVGSCNAGAKKARGKYLVFLNNDTSIKKGWLNALWKTFQNDKNIGLVGSKLIYPDGRLQEAGGIVWRDGNGCNYGRFENPQNAEFNYLKDVDYCSGASIMLPKDVFERLDGFDVMYSPGYYEDTDLAFRVRKLGMRTVYQPKSELFHFEGISSGNDLNRGMKKYQEVNREKFSSRWKETLDKENFDDMKGDAFLARDRSKNRKVVLFMDNNVPTFDKDAGSFIAFQYIKVLNDLNYKVIFWPHNLEKIEPYTDILQQMGVEVMYGERNFSEYINKYGESIDFAFVSRPHVAEAYMYLIRKKSSAKIFYIAHDLHFLREMRAAEVGKDKNLEKIASDTKKIEESMMSKSDVSLFFSGDEVKIVKKEFAEVSVDVLPWVQNIENSSPADFKDRKGLIFMGGYNHPPNVDAVKWFHKEVFPLVIKKVPNIEVTIYGSHVPKEISSLNARNFKVIGFIEEEKIKDIFDSAKIFIAPLRFGAGFKGKIAKAMSNGLPVITTDIGAEGMGLVDGENALIGNDSEAVANKIIRLYSDEALWNKISKNSLRYIGDNYSVDNAQHKIEKLLASDMGCKKYS